MKEFNFKVSMNGFLPVEGQTSAKNKKDAQIIAINKFLDKNDIEIDNASEDELIQFYAPSVNKLK